LGVDSVSDALAQVQSKARDVQELRARLRAETAELRQLILAADQAGAGHDDLVDRARGGLSRAMVYAMFSDDDAVRERNRYR